VLEYRSRGVSACSDRGVPSPKLRDSLTPILRK